MRDAIIPLAGPAGFLTIAGAETDFEFSAFEPGRIRIVPDGRWISARYRDGESRLVMTLGNGKTAVIERAELPEGGGS